MTITLSHEECRKALYDAALEKVSHCITSDIENAFFIITAGGKELDDVEAVEFIIGD